VKRPYAQGDRFAVPLGDGRYVAGIVTHGTRKAVCGSFFGPAVATVKELDAPGPLQLRAADAMWSGRFSDRALVALRWPLLRAHPAFVRAEWPAAAGRAAEPGEVERMLAALAGGQAYRRERLSVLDVTSARDLRGIEQRGGRVRLQWRSPLAPVDLAAAARAAAGGASLRLYGAAVSQVGTLASCAPFACLALDAATIPRGLPPFPHVRDLELDGVPEDQAAIFAAFPSLESLRVRARGARIDATHLADLASLRRLYLDAAEVRACAHLARLTALRSLDLRDARVDDIDAVLALPLQALRLTRVEPLRSLEMLRGNMALRTLSLGESLDLTDLHPIADLPRLESLELRGLWQFDVADAAFVESMPSLRRLYVDLGGRRKNVELYKHRSLALPLPF
jgi:hypothetical protein